MKVNLMKVHTRYNEFNSYVPETDPEENEEGSDIKKAFAPFMNEITSLSDASFPNDGEIAGEGPMPQVQDQEPNDGSTDSPYPIRL